MSAPTETSSPRGDGSRATSALDRWMVGAVVGIGVLAMGLTVLLSNSNRELRDSIAKLQERMNLPTAGMYVPGFLGHDLDGEDVQVGANADEQVQVLLYFNTRCSFSRASVERWKQLARELGPAGGTHVVGISLDSAHLTPQYVKEHALNYPVVHFPGENARFTYRAQTVPVTIVVRPDGFVTHVRQGAVETAAARDSLIGAAEWTADRWAEIRNESAGGEKVEEAPRDGSSGSG